MSQYDPADTMTITIPKHTAHLLNSLACMGYTDAEARKQEDDRLAYADYIQTYAQEAGKTT